MEGLLIEVDVRKMTGNNFNIYRVHIKTYTKFGQILYIFLKILSGNKIMTSIKGHDSVANKLCRTYVICMSLNTPNL